MKDCMSGFFAIAVFTAIAIVATVWIVGTYFDESDRDSMAQPSMTVPNSININN